jgi:superoxide dismutase, Cu-Zn family
MRHALLIVSCLAFGPTIANETPTPDSKAPAKAVAPPPEAQTPVGAGAELKPTRGSSVSGTLSFVAEKNGVRIGGLVKGLTANTEQGFHVHEKGDCSAPDASSAGGHFNPTSQAHGNPKTSAPRHLGDIVNLRADAQGIAKVDALITGATLQSGQATDVVGKAIVVHQKPDDYTSQPAGDSGERAACGVIK